MTRTQFAVTTQYDYPTMQAMIAAARAEGCTLVGCPAILRWAGAQASVTKQNGSKEIRVPWARVAAVLSTTGAF